MKVRAFEGSFCYKVAKFILWFACLLSFFAIMVDVWTKFATEFTTTVVRSSFPDSEVKQLPCVVVKSTNAFKTVGMFFREAEFQANSFQMEDIFLPDTIAKLKDSSKYSVTEVDSIVHGKIFMICHRRGNRFLETEHLLIKNDKNYDVFTLEEEDHFWLLVPYRFPYFIATTNLHIRNDLNYVIADHVISHVEIQDRSAPLCPCSAYEDFVATGNRGFTDCSKRVLHSLLEGRLRCRVPGLLMFGGHNLTECRTSAEATDVVRLVSNVTREFLRQPHKFGCPLPCHLTHYEVSNHFYPPSSAVWYEEVTSGSFLLIYFYDTFLVEERMETLVYDLSALLVSIGGNLGLFLGYSCLTIGLAFLEIFGWVCSRCNQFVQKVPANS